MIDSRAIGGAVVKKSIVINSSQNWTAPANLAGNTAWLTGCAGGGSGAQISSTGSAIGGFGGAYCIRRPVIVAPSTSYAATIPAGGAADTSGNGNAGGDLSFGSLVTLKGGKGGASTSSGAASRFFDAMQASGVRPNIFVDTSSTDKVVAFPADTVNGNVCGESSSTTDSYATGGAAGLFGNGGNASSSTTAQSALDNTGAGGGAVRNVGGTSGAGGSGCLVIEWEEFL
jgi:hypothetical protein